MTQEQALKLAKEHLTSIEDICSKCPYESIDPQNGCTVENCGEFHVALGIQIGYNKALEDLKAPKTLAENRED
jgi:hypothetical protein